MSSPSFAFPFQYYFSYLGFLTVPYKLEVCLFHFYNRNGYWSFDRGYIKSVELWVILLSQQYETLQFIFIISIYLDPLLQYFEIFSM